MKAIILGALALSFTPLSFANLEPLLLDAACSYDCIYTVQQCNEGCWEVRTSRKKYIDFRGLSLEAIDLAKSSRELRNICLKTLPEHSQWDSNAQFSKIEDFECQYFKH